MMKFYSLQPSEKLKEFIKVFWVLEGSGPYKHYTMPDVCPEMVFHYNGCFAESSGNPAPQKSFTAGIHAQTSKRRDFYTNEAFGIFGVSLYPYTIPLLFNIPANELTNEMPGLECLIKTGTGLAEQIALATDTKKRVAIIEDFVAERLTRNYKNDLPVFYAIRDAIEKKRLITVKEMTGKYFLSERQFERQFWKFAGFSPKLFIRIARFHAAMACYAGNEKSLTRVALSCGYYDQSHFIHDFKEFSGFLPKVYFSGDTEATKWRD